MHWPQFIYLFLTAMSLGYHVSKSGKPKEGTYKLSDFFISAFIGYVILYYGGFFAPIGFAP